MAVAGEAGWRLLKDKHLNGEGVTLQKSWMCPSTTTCSFWCGSEVTPASSEAGLAPSAQRPSA